MDNSALFATDEIRDPVDGVEVVRQHLAVLNLDAKGVLDEEDDFEHTRRVDDATIQQGCPIFKRCRVCHVEVRRHKSANLFFDFHLDILPFNLKTSLMRECNAIRGLLHMQSFYYISISIHVESLHRLCPDTTRTLFLTFIRTHDLHCIL